MALSVRGSTGAIGWHGDLLALDRVEHATYAVVVMRIAESLFQPLISQILDGERGHVPCYPVGAGQSSRLPLVVLVRHHLLDALHLALLGHEAT